LDAVPRAGQAEGDGFTRRRGSKAARNHLGSYEHHERSGGAVRARAID
jgi:hypothetical protein